MAGELLDPPLANLQQASIARRSGSSIKLDGQPSMKRDPAIIKETLSHTKRRAEPGGRAS